MEIENIWIHISTVALHTKNTFHEVYILKYNTSNINEHNKNEK